jgi:hypothetical protein
MSEIQTSFLVRTQTHANILVHNLYTTCRNLFTSLHTATPLSYRRSECPVREVRMLNECWPRFAQQLQIRRLKINVAFTLSPLATFRTKYRFKLQCLRQRCFPSQQEPTSLNIKNNKKHSSRNTFGTFQYLSVRSPPFFVFTL